MDPRPRFSITDNTTQLPITVPLPESHTVPFMPPLYRENTMSRDLQPQHSREFGFGESSETLLAGHVSPSMQILYPRTLWFPRCLAHLTHSIFLISLGAVPR